VRGVYSRSTLQCLWWERGEGVGPCNVEQGEVTREGGAGPGQWGTSIFIGALCHPLGTIFYTF
jgi:hypothetical protein